jgi:hypothetical protein
MRWCVSIGALLAAAAIVAGDVAGIAAPSPKSQQTDGKETSVDLELVIAVDVSYSMDLDELAVQREGYAQAIVSKDFLQAMKSGPNSKVAVTYFEWSASSEDHSAGLTDMSNGQLFFPSAELVMHENEPAHWFDDGAITKVDERSHAFVQTG